MPNATERLLFWDKQLSTRRLLTPRELMESFYRAFNEEIAERTFKEDLKKLRDEHNAPLKNERFDNRNQTLLPTEKSHYFYEADFSMAPKIMPFTVEDADRIQQAMEVLRQFKHLPHLRDLESVLFKLEHEAGILPTAPSKKEKKTKKDKEEAKEETDKNDIISFDQVPQLKGFWYLEALYRAIKKTETQKMLYKPFDTVSQWVTVHPYFLKEFNNRWFVYGLDHDTNKIIPFALDRIQLLEKSPFLFRPNQKIETVVPVTKFSSAIVTDKRIDFSTFFKNRIGITYFEGDTVETIRIKVAHLRAQYIITKPWHESQMLEQETPQYSHFKFELVVNKELQNQILSFGKDIEVLEPLHLRATIQATLTQALENYK